MTVVLDTHEEKYIGINYLETTKDDFLFAKTRKQMIVEKIIRFINTPLGGRICDPDFGTVIPYLLFATPKDMIIEPSEIEEMLTIKLNKYIPEITVKTVSAALSQNTDGYYSLLIDLELFDTKTKSIFEQEVTMGGIS